MRRFEDDMAPIDRIHLPFRWEFAPVREPRDGSVRWTWRAYQQTGTLALEAHRLFDSLTECIEDARKSGYAEP